MLRVFCIDNLGLTVEDIYFRDPDPAPDQQGDERGIRVELRVIDPQPWQGSIYGSQRVVVDQAIWRVDLLESVKAGPGSKDRMHHHPGMADGEPGKRVFDHDLTEDPMGWLERRLADVLPLLEAAKVPDADAYRPAASAFREALPELMGSIKETLDGVRTGRLAREPNAP